MEKLTFPLKEYKYKYTGLNVFGNDKTNVSSKPAVK